MEALFTQRAVDAPCLKAFKARLDRALGSLSWWGAALPMARDWEWVGFELPFNMSRSMAL